MEFFALSYRTGARKRDVLDYFRDEAEAKAVAESLDADSAPEVTAITVFEGTATAWLLNRDQRAREAILAKLNDSERALLGL